MKEYLKTQGGSFRVSGPLGEVFIPEDDGNKEYVLMQAEVADGRAVIVMEPAPEPIKPVDADAMRLDQLRKDLKQLGIGLQ